MGLDYTHPKSTHVLIFDADFIPPSDIVSRFLARFRDDGVVAVQGYQRHDLNAEENWITRFSKNDRGKRACDPQPTASAA